MGNNAEIEASSGKRTPDGWMALAGMFELTAMGLMLPTTTLAEALSSGEYADACSELAAFCGYGELASAKGLSVYRGANPTVLLGSLRREYTGYFSKAPEPAIVPYLGVWHERQKGCGGLLFVSRKSLEIERFMLRCGVRKNVSEGQSNDPVDHIGTVCEFMKYLCLVNARAIEPGAAAEVRNEGFDAFRAEHFEGYALWCSDRLRELNCSPYYGFIAEALAYLAR